MKVRPLLAATRNDEELRQKEIELALIKERADRDKQEREALEKLKMSLETEKRKVEDALEAERALAVDKDTLLERSKKRESELEEEINALQSDIATLDSQLIRAMRLQKESEDKYEVLRKAFDEAAEHLVRLEQGENVWHTRETELREELKKAQDEIDTLQSDLDELHHVSEELKSLAVQREEDLLRTRDRTDTMIKELRGKLDVEARNRYILSLLRGPYLLTSFYRDILKEKSEQVETEARQAKEQLTELARTATEYSTMLQKKEDQINALMDEIDGLKEERDRSSTEVLELRADIDVLDAQLNDVRKDRVADIASKEKLQEEMDELRAIIATKTTEESRRFEVEKSKELELVDLRNQCSRLHQELTDVRSASLEAQNKLKRELEHTTRDYTSLQHSHKSLLDRERAAQSQLTKLQSQLSDLEKTKRSLDSELLTIKGRQHEIQDELSQASRAKEVSFCCRICIRWMWFIISTVEP